VTNVSAVALDPKPPTATMWQLKYRSVETVFDCLVLFDSHAQIAFGLALRL
jgi:hypothetical protein